MYIFLLSLSLFQFFNILLLFPLPLSVLSDERAQQIIDQALNSGSMKQRNVVATLTGLTGYGKTWLLNRLFYRKTPDLYTSAGITEQSF